MKGKRYLVKNILFLTIGQFGTKLLSFFLVPLYTSVLTSAEYGTFDLYSATVSLFIPILTLNISDSTTIFLLDKEKSKEGIISISLKHFVYSVIIFGAFILFNLVFNFFPLFNEYPLFLFLMFSVNVLNNLLLSYARGLDKIKEVSVSGVLCSVVMIALNITFLLPLHLGLTGYYLAIISGSFIQIVYLTFSINIFKFIKIRRQEKKLKKEMLGYSCPMLFNSLSWWINNVSDRYMVTFFCGVMANGIYSVAYKIPSILTMFQGIFHQAWTLSAVQDFDKDDKSGFFAKMYALYNVCMVLLCSVVILLDKPLALFLYSKDFYAAWKYVPFLLVSVVFGSLSSYLGGIFAAVKDSKSFVTSTAAGAVSNIILNFILIYFIGALGAAVATAVTGGVVWAMRLYNAKKIMKLKVSLLRDCVSYAVLFFQCTVLLFSDDFFALAYGLNALSVLVLCILYRRNFTDIADFVSRKLKLRRSGV